jgi:hypothetical protein
MRQRTSNLLYSYWNSVRQGRRAPCRYEIEPAKIAALLPETFIVECGARTEYRIRLAGTRICDQFGRELRNSSLLDFWTPHDREAMANLLHNVIQDGAVGVAHFAARKEGDRRVDFEMTLMPLIHNDQSVNRVLGCITAIDPPFWLGTVRLDDFELKDVNLLWPDGAPVFITASGETFADGPVPGGHLDRLSADEARRRFKVYEGGRAD